MGDVVAIAVLASLFLLLSCHMQPEVLQKLYNVRPSRLNNILIHGSALLVSALVFLSLQPLPVDQSSGPIENEFVVESSVATERAGVEQVVSNEAVPTSANQTVGDEWSNKENAFVQTDAKVTRVIDGDTIEVSINGELKTVRYIGINTPETVHPSKPVECFGKEASAKNRSLVEGQVVRLEKDVSDTDTYGRLLRYVYVGDVFVNLRLVEEGFASASSYPPDVRFNSEFREAESTARDSGRGLWGDVCNEPAVEVQENSDVPAQVIPVTQNSGQCTIKGNINSEDEKIYHTVGCQSYQKTVIDEAKGEKWFCSEQEALNSGWRKALNC